MRIGYRYGILEFRNRRIGGNWSRQIPAFCDNLAKDLTLAHHSERGPDMKFWRILLEFGKPSNPKTTKPKSFSMEKTDTTDYYRHLKSQINVPEGEIHSIAELVEYAERRPNLADWFLKMQRLESWLTEAGLPLFASLATDARLRVGVPNEDRLALFLGLCRGEESHGEAIEKAVCSGDLEKLKTLLKDDPRLALRRYPNGLTPLHLVAGVAKYIPNRIETAELLLANGANVNAKTPDGRTPLHLVASAPGYINLTKTAELLLANGAKVNAKTTDGRTPLHLVKGVEMAELLLANGAKVNAKTPGGRIPLHEAYGDVEGLLLRNGADDRADPRTAQLIKQLRSQDSSTRFHAAEALGKTLDHRHTLVPILDFLRYNKDLTLHFIDYFHGIELNLLHWPSLFPDATLRFIANMGPLHYYHEFQVPGAMESFGTKWVSWSSVKLQGLAVAELSRRTGSRER
ncbi:MAG: ankyrin repeat domain-containing protein [Xanthobacteraceae bacterium]